MTDIFYKPKIDDAVIFQSKLQNLLEEDHDHCPVVVPYGIQQQYSLKVPKQVQLCLHSISSGAHTIVVHYGAGVCNKIGVWTQDGDQYKARRVLFGATIEQRILRLLYLPNNFLFVAACADMTIKTYSNQFTVNAVKELNYTVLDMIYYEPLDVIITSSDGFMQAFRLGNCLHDPLVAMRKLKLPIVRDSKPWIFQISVDNKSQDIIAVCHQAVFFICGNTVENLQCKRVLENRHALSMSCAVTYAARQYIITGAKDGTIKAWNTTMKRFPLFGNFQGHTKSIMQLAINSNNPILFSSATDNTIRIWDIETFSEMYRLNVHEPIISFSQMGPTSLIYTTQHEAKVCELHLFYSLFSNIGAQARQLSRVSCKGIPSRIVYTGRDGGIRIISPVHGTIINMMFPVIDHQLIDVIHDSRHNTNYAVLGDGNVLVFSTETNPCSTIQIWRSKSIDDKVLSLETLDITNPKGKEAESSMETLLFGGHMSGHISLLKGIDFHLDPIKAHHGCVTMLHSRRYPYHAESQTSVLMASYGTDNIIHVWDISANFDITNNYYDLQFSPALQIDMIDSPSVLLFVGDTLSITTKKHLLLHKLEEKKGRNNAVNYNQTDFIEKSLKQVHYGKISQICCCESLEIFATSGKDRQVRVWDTRNELIRELSFDDDVEGICFANGRGDLLVALQGNLYLVPAWYCLNRFYVKQLLDMKLEDDISEMCIAFDPLLKFWYDDFWVQKVPMDRTNCVKIRRSAKKSIGLTKDEYSRLKTLLLSHLLADNTEDISYMFSRRYNKRRKTVFQVQKELRRSTQNSLEPLPPINDSKSISSHKLNFVASSVDCKQDDSTKNRTVQNQCIFEEDSCLEDPLVEISHIDGQCNSNSMEENEIEHNEESIDDITNCLSKFWPCAPDGFLPNSVVRSIIQPIAPPDYSAIVNELDEKEAQRKIQQVIMDLSKLPRLVKSEEEIHAKPDSPENLSEDSISEIRRRILFGDDDDDDDDDDSDDSYTASCCDEKEDEIESRNGHEFLLKTETSNKSEKITHVKPKKIKTDKSALEKKQTNIMLSTPKKKGILKNVTTKEKLKDKKKGSKASKNDNKKPEKSITIQTAPDMSGVRFLADNEAVKNDEEIVSLHEEFQDDSTHEIFKSRMDKPWFPKNIELNAANIVRETLKSLNERDALITREICALFVDIKKHLELETPILDEMLASLQKLMESKSPAVKLVAVKTAVQLAEQSKEKCDLVLGDLIKMLGDPAKIIREEAKQALSSLAGVNDFATLENAARRVSVLKGNPNYSKDVEVLDDIKDRMKSNISKSSDRAQMLNRLMNEWLITARPRPLTDEESNEEMENEEVRLAENYEADQEGTSERSRKDITSTNYIELIAPRLVKKFGRLSGSESRFSSQDAVSSEEVTGEEDDVNFDISEFETKANVNPKFIEHSKGAFETKDSVALNKKEIHKKPGQIHIIADNKKPKRQRLSFAEKEKIISLLFEVSAYTLLMKRNFGQQNSTTSNENALRGLTNVLTLIEREDPQLVRSAGKVLEYLKQQKSKMRKEVAKFQVDPKVATSAVTHSKGASVVEKEELRHLNPHRQLISSPISRSLVPGIRGERIAQSMEFINMNKNRPSSTREHKIIGIPERLGNVAAADSGVCQFGKMKMLWTSRAPCYDMDFTALNEQRIRPLHIPRRTLSNVKELSGQEQNQPLLPLLFKQRLSTASQKMRGSVDKKESSKRKLKRRVIRLPRLTVDTEGAPRADSTGSYFSESVDLNRSKDPSNPPPPPNTAELRL